MKTNESKQTAVKKKLCSKSIGEQAKQTNDPSKKVSKQKHLNLTKQANQKNKRKNKTNKQTCKLEQQQNPGKQPCKHEKNQTCKVPIKQVNKQN